MFFFGLHFAFCLGDLRLCKKSLEIHFRSGATVLKNSSPQQNKAFSHEENLPSFIPDISRGLGFDLGHFCVLVSSYLEWELTKTESLCSPQWCQGHWMNVALVHEDRNSSGRHWHRGHMRSRLSCNGASCGMFSVRWVNLGSTWEHRRSHRHWTRGDPGQTFGSASRAGLYSPLFHCLTSSTIKW